MQDAQSGGRFLVDVQIEALNFPGEGDPCLLDGVPCRFLVLQGGVVLTTGDDVFEFDFVSVLGNFFTVVFP